MLRHLLPARSLCLALAALSLAAPVHVQAAAPQGAETPQYSDLDRFYAARPDPIWVGEKGLNGAGHALLALLEGAKRDGLDPADYLDADLKKALRAKLDKPEARKALDRRLSGAFVKFVQDSRTVPASMPVAIGDRWAYPGPPSTLEVMSALAADPMGYLRDLRWMHPIYRGLREEVTRTSDPAERRILLENMDRARLLPVNRPRYILVDAAAAELYVYEGNAPRASMRVIVGAPETETPMIASTIYWAALNPYWHVPGHITRDAIAKRVLAEGMKYFNGRGYQVVDEWSHDPKIIDPKTVDWKAVAEGRKEIKVRQKPGPGNGMGKVKFQFPNDLGIYLHDTPGKHLFDEVSRDLSNGCVRLEDADGLAKILFDGKVPDSDKPEDLVNLPTPVPVYLTYFTRFPGEGGVVRRADVYRRDQLRQAAGETRSANSAR
ncbi:L,D-transpeptidase family protein [Sphingomicrobium lutaoense]|uniref:Murein L,D-transpeptidase YcbB/YkuD n=1 Tax=Sphingomicrobium lutaoense TaxID=515949 RepID=A0A839Z2R1_9SPHN|nr:L,D-transpeptidase family protein [Sphingomicrobium lutaoense]MBB3764910.1 murein L,D-transpeptidase YcbB/YkuD [Sphingomicrobium lutaoense]